MSRTKRYFARAVGSRRSRVLTAVSALALVVVAVAAAQWFFNLQNPPARGKFRSIQAVTAATPTVDPANTCAPAEGCDMVVNLTNPNQNGLLHLISLGGSPTIQNVTVTGALNNTGCQNTLANHLTIRQGAVSPSVDVPPGTNNVTVPSLVSTDSTLPNDCQGGSFTLTFSGLDVTLQQGG